MKTPPPIIATPQPPQTRTFAHQAAKASWSTVVTICILLVFSGAARQPKVTLFVETLSFLLMVAGLALGIFALFGIRTHGRKGILAPAIVGIVLNALLLFIFVTNFLAARAKAQRDAAAAVVNSDAPGLF